MTLTGSGQISFDNIRVELNVPSQASFNLRSASAGAYGNIQVCQSPRPNTATPDALNEWWGYNHSATASLAYNFVTERSTVSCAAACALLDDEDTAQLLAYSVSSNPSFYFGDAQCLTEIPNQGYFAVDFTTCYTVTANSISTSSCGTTTTTTTSTSTTLGTGTCYQTTNSNISLDREVGWTDRTGTSRTGFLSPSTTVYLCSTTTPVELPSATGDISATTCTNLGATPCTITCTSLGCKQCADGSNCF